MSPTTRQVVSTVVLLLLVLGAWLLMWRGWRARARRDATLPTLPAVPGDLGAVRWGPADATYVSTTSEGDWLDRVVAHGLGSRSAAEVTLAERGLVVRRPAGDLFVPAQALLGARRESGQAGKFVGREGLVVVSWTLGERALQTGLRLRHAASTDELVTAITSSAKEAA